jgi:hypothetical protein
MHMLIYEHSRWIPFFLVAHGMETSCMALAKMLVLGRLVKHVQSASVTRLIAARQDM